MTLEPRRPGVGGALVGAGWGGWAWEEWTLRASERKVTETIWSTLLLYRCGYRGSHSRQGLQQGLSPGPWLLSEGGRGRVGVRGWAAPCPGL